MLLAERDEALVAPARAASFRRFRCNLPGGDPERELLSPESWKDVLAREPAPAAGRCVVGIDLGTAPSWSAAVAIWPTGRMDACALAPGLPGLDAQERRDRAPRGLYHRLVDDRVLLVAHDRRAPTVRQLVDEVWRRWQPRVIIGDRVRQNELRDAVGGRPCRVVLRVARWSEASEDIGAFRRLCLELVDEVWRRAGAIGSGRTNCESARISARSGASASTRVRQSLQAPGRCSPTASAPPG